MRGRLLATGVVVALLSGCATTTSSSSSGSAADAALATPCADLHDYVTEAHRAALDTSALQREALAGVNDSTDTMLAKDFKSIGDLTVQIVNGQIPNNTSDLYTAINDAEATCTAANLWVYVPDHT